MVSGAFVTDAALKIVAIKVREQGAQLIKDGTALANWTATHGSNIARIHRTSLARLASSQTVQFFNKQMHLRA